MLATMLTTMGLLGSLVGRRSARFYCTAAQIASKVGYLERREGLKEEIEKLVKGDKVVVFMKGTPDAPQCGFSNAVVQIMGIHDVAYSAVNVLDHPEIREGVKAYSEWPTIPQIYLDGEFLGGCDIMIEMHKSGDLVTTLKKAGITSKFEESKS